MEVSRREEGESEGFSDERRDHQDLDSAEDVIRNALEVWQAERMESSGDGVSGLLVQEDTHTDPVCRLAKEKGTKKITSTIATTTTTTKLREEEEHGEQTEYDTVTVDGCVSGQLCENLKMYHMGTES